MKYLGQGDKSLCRTLHLFVLLFSLSQMGWNCPSTALGQRACKFCLPNQGQEEARSTGFQSGMPVYVSTFSTVKFKFKIGLYMSEDVDFYS